MISKLAPIRWRFFKAAWVGRILRAIQLAACAVVTPGVMQAGEIDDAKQLLVAIAPTWDAQNGRLQRFERAGHGWKAVAPPVPVLFGKGGLVWGRGVFGTDEPGLHKSERDGRAPAGVFRIGTIYTYDAALPA